MPSEVSVLICSCDRYEDVWRPFFTLLFRYWTDCPWPIYLITNQKQYPDDRVQSLRIGPDHDWSSVFVQALERVPSSRVLVMMEDYLLSGPVDTGRIQRLDNYMVKHNAACMRLRPEPGPDAQCVDDPEIGEISPGQDFRVCLQAAIWDRQVLIQLARPGESAWAFEIVGTQRSLILDRSFYSVMGAPHRSPLPYYCTGVVRGKWMPGAVRLCQKEGIPIDLNSRSCAWVKGWIRENRAFLPLRLLYVHARRALGRY